MVRASWWQAVRQVLNPAARRGLRCIRRSRPYQPWLQDLEERLAPTVTLSISSPAPFPKPGTGQLMGMFVVTRSGDPAPAVQVDYHTQDGSGPNGAHAGTDYVAAAGTLEFAADQTMATITVPIIGNQVFQADKTFTVSLSNPQSNTVVFTPPQDLPTFTPPSLKVGDFNGDGKSDLVVLDQLGVTVLLNTTPTGATAPSFIPQQPLSPNNGNLSIALGDFNADGRTDVAIADFNSGVISVFLNTTPMGATALSFAPPQTFASGGNPFEVAVGDFNGDGKPDLVFDTTSSAVAVLTDTTPTGATTLSFAPPQTFAVSGGVGTLLAADFNGDGKPDLAIANTNGTVSVLLDTTAMGATTPSFAPEQTFPTGSSLGSVSVAVGDFNGDGKPDFAIGDGSMVSVLLDTTPVASFTQLPAVGCVQGDGCCLIRRR